MLSWGRHRDHSSKLGLHWGCWVCGRPRWRGSRLRQMVWPRGRCLSGAATELGLSHFLKQVGEGKRRKERKHSHGPWLSDWCFIYLISFDDFTSTRRGGGGIWWGTLPFVLLLSGFYHRPFQPLSHCIPRRSCFLFQMHEVPSVCTPIGPLFFSQVTWGHRGSVSSSCFGSDLIVCLISITLFFVSKSDLWVRYTVWLSSYFAYIWFCFGEG